MAALGDSNLSFGCHKGATCLVSSKNIASINIILRGSVLTISYKFMSLNLIIAIINK